MPMILQDLRFGLRMMARTPAMTAVAVLMLAAGTGANATMFSVIDAVMLRVGVDPLSLSIVNCQL